MSIVTVDNYALDKIIDERIEMAMNIASEYSGCGLFDEDGKLVDTGTYQLTKGTMLSTLTSPCNNSGTKVLLVNKLGNENHFNFTRPLNM